MRSRRTLAVALVLLPLLAALVPLVVPPWRFALVPARIATAALGPEIALLALALGAGALRLSRGAPRMRGLLGATAVGAAGLAVLPTLGARHAAAEGALAIAALPGARAASTAEDVGAPNGLFGALRGLPAPPEVETHVVRYDAAHAIGTSGSPLVLRRYRDPRRCASPCPTVIVLYGGAWRSGDATQSAPVDRWLASRGYTVIALDYRHAPVHRFPAQRDDVRRGLALVRDSAAAWGVDVQRAVLWGRSSGGHLATLTAWGADAAALPVRVRGVISYYAPFDLARGYREPPSPDPIGVRVVLRGFLGGPPDSLTSAYRAASPKSHVRPGLVPSLLVYAGADHLVKPEFGRAAAAALRASGSPVVHVELPWAEHGFDLAHGGPLGAAALGLVLRFLEAVA